MSPAFHDIAKTVCALAAAGSLVAACERDHENRADAGEPETQGYHFIAGTHEPGRQPDGNTVIFSGPGGLILVDTGRHKEHQDRIIAYAAGRGEPIDIIVNTHWHLDHTGGNAELRAAYPAAKIYATRAVDGALEGFLARGRAQSEELLESPDLTDAQKADVRLDMDATDHPEDLRPDVPVDGVVRLAADGRKIELHVAENAATAGDIWVWDPLTKTAIAGDLVTLPAPFLDTACPAGWLKGLDAIAAKSPEHVIPGHGAPMTPEAFGVYRSAFETFINCAADERRDDCAARWAAGATPLLGESEHGRAEAYAQYYVDNVLRKPAHAETFCPATD